MKTIPAEATWRTGRNRHEIQGGKVDPAEQLPAFLQALEDAGINDVIAAKQAQYDEWRAAQE